MAAKAGNGTGEVPQCIRSSGMGKDYAYTYTVMFTIKTKAFPGYGHVFRELYDKMGIFGQQFDDKKPESILIKIRTVEAASCS